jgi:hypothetical protein
MIPFYAASRALPGIPPACPVCGKLYLMPSLEFMRGVLGALALGCVYMAARSLVAYRNGWQKISRLWAWGLRTAVCLAAVAYRHPVDTTDIVVLSLGVLVFALGYWEASRPRKQEDLSHEIFPE